MQPFTSEPADSFHVARSTREIGLPASGKERRSPSITARLRYPIFVRIVNRFTPSVYIALAQANSISPVASRSPVNPLHDR